MSYRFDGDANDVARWCERVVEMVELQGYRFTDLDAIMDDYVDGKDPDDVAFDIVDEYKLED